MMKEQLNISHEVLHLVPLLGPLHVSLNTHETCLLIFHPFFNALYKDVFQKKVILQQSQNLGGLIYFSIFHMQDGYLFVLLYCQNLKIQKISAFVLS